MNRWRKGFPWLCIRWPRSVSTQSTHQSEEHRELTRMCSRSTS